MRNIFRICFITTTAHANSLDFKNKVKKNTVPTVFKSTGMAVPHFLQLTTHVHIYANVSHPHSPQVLSIRELAKNKQLSNKTYIGTSHNDLSKASLSMAYGFILR